MRKQDAIDTAEIAAIYAELETAMRALLASEGARPEDITLTREIEACYVGQSFRLKLSPPPLDAQFVPRLVADFNERHREAYGFANTGERTQLVNLRLNGTGRVQRPTLRRLDKGSGGATHAMKGQRPVYFTDPARPRVAKIYDRDRLLAGDAFDGPAIVEQMDSTTVVMPGARVVVAYTGSLVISIEGTQP